jgi:hypothetical protein
VDEKSDEAIVPWKVDCLALGMLSCMKRGFDLLSQHKGIHLDLATIPAEDPRTRAILCQTVLIYRGQRRDDAIRMMPEALHLATKKEGSDESQIAITAWSAKVSTSLMCFSANRRAR